MSELRVGLLQRHIQVTLAHRPRELTTTLDAKEFMAFRRR